MKKYVLAWSGTTSGQHGKSLGNWAQQEPSLCSGLEWAPWSRKGARRRFWAAEQSGADMWGWNTSVEHSLEYSHPSSKKEL